MTTLTVSGCWPSTRSRGIRSRGPAALVRRQGYKPRLPLDAADDVIGACLFFPDDKSNTPYRYVSADISGIVLDSDEPDIEELDREDEQVGLVQEAEAAVEQRGT